MEPAEFELRRRIALETRERQRAEYASFGWHEIVDESEATALLDTFNAAFFPNGKLCTPTPFITWDVSRLAWAQTQSSELRSLIDDLHHKCLRALKRCCVGSEPWYALENYNHPCYRVNFTNMPEDLAEWPIEILPYADPCYLLAADFSLGILAVLRKSITVFGGHLVSAVIEDTPLALTDVVRSGLSDA